MFEADFALGDQRAAQFQELDGYYVIYSGPLFGHSQHFLKVNYDRLLKSDPRFRGFILENDAQIVPEAHASNPVITAFDFMRMRRSEKVGLVHFFTTKVEFAFWARFRKHLFSFMCALQVRNLPHTYVPVPEERRFIQDNLPRFLNIIDSFDDADSARMLTARLKGIASLDIEPLVHNNVPLEYEYFNGLSPHISFILKEREDLVDVGASWGDCVIRFAETVDDLKGSTIQAFEPNAVEFSRLQLLESSLPVKAHNAIVTDHTGTAFFETLQSNLHGSRLVDSGSDDDQRSTVRLDDVCERATLIKIDAEGAEPEILAGAERLLTNPECRLSSCIYHYPADLFKTIDIMAEYGRKRFFFRQHNATMFDALVYFH